MNIKMKNTKKLVLSLVSMLVITGFLLTSVNIVSASLPPIGRITNLTCKSTYISSTHTYTVTLDACIKNIGSDGRLWIETYLQTGPSSWTRIYSTTTWLNYGQSKDYIGTLHGVPPGTHTFKVQVGFTTTQDIKTITITLKVIDPA